MNMKLMLSLSMLVVLVLSMSVASWPALPAAAAGSTYYVRPSGNDTSGQGTQASPWRTINYAVSRAANGDTIKVMDDDNEATDDYVENVVVDKSLTIERYDNVGVNPQVKAFNSSVYVFDIKADNVTLGGLDIFGANAFASQTSGVRLDSVKDCLIESNRIGWDEGHQNWGGITLRLSSGNVIRGNSLDYNEADDISVTDSNGNTVMGNTCRSDQCAGIWLSYSSNNTVSDNILTDHFCYGFGIFLDRCSGNLVSNNTAMGNATGIASANDSHNNTIVGNTLSGNYYGMEFYADIDSSYRGAYDNVIYRNSLVDSIRGSIMTGVQKGGVNNIWHTPDIVSYVYNGQTHIGYLGNYYSDYAGVDANGNGVGDTPYTVGEVCDKYPLMSNFAGQSTPLDSSLGPSFTASATWGTMPLTIQFTDGSIGYGINSWLWDFGDGQTSNVKNPLHTYQSRGAYTVSLTVTGIDGTATTTKKNYILVIDVLVWQIVSPGADCTVQTPEGTITLQFPAGAVTSQANVVVKRLSAAEAPSVKSGFRFGDTYFSVEGADNLEKEVTICIKYTDADLAAAGGDPNKLTLSYYDEVLGEWVIVDTTVDTAAQTLTATTSHFSSWVVMGEESYSDGSSSGFPLWGWGLVGVAGLLVVVALSFGLGYKLARR